MRVCACARRWRATRRFFLRFASSILSFPRLLELLAVRDVLALPHERLFGEIVAPFLDGEHCLLLPIAGLLELRVGLIAQPLFVGDGCRHLLLGLRELTSHVNQNLVEHFLGIFGPRDQVIDVRPQEGREPIEYSHGLVCLAVRAELTKMRRERDGDALVGRQEFFVVEMRKLESFGHHDRFLFNTICTVHQIRRVELE